MLARSLDSLMENKTTPIAMRETREVYWGACARACLI